MSTDIQHIVSKLSSLSIMDVAELVKSLESEWGVSAAAPVAAAPAAGAAPAASAEEKTEFTLFLASAGEKKINVIKEVRAITALGLAEAKQLVESAPTVLKEGMNKEDVTKAESLLKAAGATVEIK